MVHDYLRLHLVPRCALTQRTATLEDCVSHAGRVADALAQGFARSRQSIVMLDHRPSEGGVRYFLGGEGVGVVYGVFFGDYFDKELLSERMRGRNPQPPPALKSYLLVADPFEERERALIAASIAMHTDLIINHEIGYPKGWQAFLRRYERMEQGSEFKIKARNVQYGSMLLDRLGITPSEWAACTKDGYERRGARLRS